MKSNIIEALREEIIDSLHWHEYRFIGQGNAVFEGNLTEDSEEQIADQILNKVLEHKRIRIEADDQSLPPVYSEGIGTLAMKQRVQQDMLLNNFVKVEGE